MTQHMAEPCISCPYRLKLSTTPFRKYIVEYKDSSRPNSIKSGCTFESCSIDPIEIGNEFLSRFIKPQAISLIRISGGLTLAELIHFDGPEDLIALYLQRANIPPPLVDHVFKELKR